MSMGEAVPEEEPEEVAGGTGGVPRRSSRQSWRSGLSMRGLESASIASWRSGEMRSPLLMEMGEPLKDVGEPLKDVGDPLKEVGEPLIELGEPLIELGEPLKEVGEPLMDVVGDSVPEESPEEERESIGGVHTLRGDKRAAGAKVREREREGGRREVGR